MNSLANTVAPPRTAPTVAAAIVNRAGDPLAVERVDVPLDEPAADEVLIEVEAFSVNRGELALLEARPDGWRPGQDVAGRVIKPATDGTGPLRGERVAGLVEEAGWATYVSVPTDRLAVVPAEVEAVSAATLGMAGLTALRILRLGGALLGRRVLVTGATGGVGRFAIQLGALQGAHMTAVATRHEDELHALGAEQVFPTVDAAGGRFDLILENVGGESPAKSIVVAAPRATLVVYGTTSGEPTPLTVYDFIGHEGVRLQSYFSYAHPETPGGDLALLLDLLAGGRLTAPIGRVLSWDELDIGLSAFRQREVSGKLVLTIPKITSSEVR